MRGLPLGWRMPCPPAHVEYLSEMLARNAATLHHLAHPDCLGFGYFRHGDHWHVGHTSYENGARCKAS